MSCTGSLRGKVLSGMQVYGMCEEDTEGGEVEAMLAMLGGLVPVEDVSPPAPGSSWTNWSHVWGREAYLKRALEKLNLEYPRDSDD
jgi:hypothetical protein